MRPGDPAGSALTPGPDHPGAGRHLGAEQWQTLVATLEQTREHGGSVSLAVRQIAASWGVAPSTVWSRLARGRDGQRRPPRPRYELTGDDRRDLYAVGGNVAALARRRSPAGSPAGSSARSSAASAAAAGEQLVWPTARTLQRAAARDLRSIERVHARRGWRTARTMLLFRQGFPAHRNAVWEADHKQLGVTVVRPDGSAGKPWVTVFVDTATRVICGWAIDLQPTETTVTCALRRALAATAFPSVGPGEPGAVGERDGTYGGIPAALRRDNGLEFAAHSLAAATAELGITQQVCPPYQSHLRGTVERLNGTVDTTLLAELPFFSGGARKADGSLYAPAGAMLSLEDLVAEFAAWVDGYHDRVHGGLAGLTPRQAWLADPTPLRWPDEAQLRGLLHRETRRIGKYGIRLHNVHYLPPKLAGMLGRQVEIRYDRHAPTELLVYVDGRYADTAFPQDAATPEQLALLRAEQAALTERMRRDRAAATRRLRRRIHPATAPGPIREAGVVAAADAARARSSRHPTADPAVRARGRLSLRADPTGIGEIHGAPAQQQRRRRRSARGR